MSVLILIAVLSFVATASAQRGVVPKGTGPVGLVFPLPDAPLSAQQMEERTRTAPDGISSTETVASQIYRDSAGRMRIEWRIQSTSGESSAVVYLIDPVASSTVILPVEPEVANRTAVPRSSSEPFQVGFPAVGRLLPAGTWRTKMEGLGTRVIDGVEVEGVRTVQTSEDQPPLIAVQEMWSSRSLGLTLVVEASGPNWRHTALLQNLDRHEPDPALFVILLMRRLRTGSPRCTVGPIGYSGFVCAL